MWENLGVIAENIAYAISVIGLCGLGWYVAGVIIDKLVYRNKKTE